MIYVSVDGDDIGSYVEYLVLKNDLKSLQQFSNDYSQAMKWLETEMKKRFIAEVVFFGGDNSMFIIHEDDFSETDLEMLRLEFLSLINKTLSIGFGASPRQAYFALKLAKASGKNSIHSYKEIEDG